MFNFVYIEDEKKKQVFSYLVLVGFILNILLPDRSNLLRLDITIPFEISVVSGFLIYTLIGYILIHFSSKTEVFILVFTVRRL